MADDRAPRHEPAERSHHRSAHSIALYFPVIHADTPTEELSQVAIDGLAGYFRTHPLPSERLAQARQAIAGDHLPVDQPLKPFRVEYEIQANDR